MVSEMIYNMWDTLENQVINLGDTAIIPNHVAVISDAYEELGKLDIAQSLRELNQMGFIPLRKNGKWEAQTISYHDFVGMMDHSLIWEWNWVVTKNKYSYIHWKGDIDLHSVYHGACMSWWQLSQRTRSRIIKKFTNQQSKKQKQLIQENNHV